MSSPANNGQTTNNDDADMASVVAQATQICNAMFIAIREVECYLKPKLAEIGILLDKRSTHALAMSCWIAMGQGKMHLRLPAKRFGKRVKAQHKESLQPVDPLPFAEGNVAPAPAKKELFSRPEALEQPFSHPEVLPALRELRELLQRDSVQEREIVRILQEATPRGTRAPASLDATPERSLQLLLDRWKVVRELVEAGRSDPGGDAA
jgi:hypothetical protein